jgi:hypothetical protein
MIEQHIQKLKTNPFIVGLIFQSFYQGYEKGTCPVLLHYLVTPLVLFKESRDLFSSITRNASLSKIIDENAIVFIELQERIWKTKELSNLSLINLQNQEKIKINEDVIIKETIKYETVNDDFKDVLRASHYLGLFFREISTVEIFKIFKVIP